jgi:hypothetical protein
LAAAVTSTTGFTRLRQIPRAHYGKKIIAEPALIGVSGIRSRKKASPKIFAGFSIEDKID